MRLKVSKMKKPMKPLLATIVALTTSLMGEEPEKRKFETFLGYKNVTVLQADWTGIRIRHADGFVNIPIEKIPEEERKKLGLQELTKEHTDLLREVKASTQEKEEQVAAVTERLQKLSFVISGEVLQVINEQGVLLRDAVRKNARIVEQKIPYTVRVRPPALAKDQTPYSETRYRTQKEYEDDWLETVFVECPTKYLFDGANFKAVVYPAGNRSYFNRNNERKTVAKYTTSLQSAINIMLPVDRGQ